MSNLKIDKPVTQAAPAANPVKLAEAPKEQKSNDGRMSQREAVFTSIFQILKNDKVNFDGNSLVKPHLTEERLKKVYDVLIENFKAKKVALKDTPSNQKKLADPSELRTYITGLVNNWIRRDPRLNGKPAKKN